MIGLIEKLEARKVAQFVVNTQPRANSNNASRWITVNLVVQMPGSYANGQLVFATMIAIGVGPFCTQPGLFQFRQRRRRPCATTKRRTAVAWNVQWTMYHDGPRALHGP